MRCVPVAASILGLLMCLGRPPVALSQSPPGSKTLTDTLSFEKTGTVSIENQRGSIRVTTWNREAVGYEIRLEPAGRDSVVLNEPTVDRSEGELEFDRSNSWSIQIPGVVTISPGGTSDPIMHYRVQIPETAHLEIDDHDSDIYVSEVKANVDIESDQGDVKVDSVDGRLTLDTYSAVVNATHLHGGISIETYDGPVDASFDTFSEASSVDTYGGTVRFRLPADAGFELRGELEDLDLMVADPFGSPTRREGSRIYGGGGPPISVETFSARVEILARGSEGASQSR